LGDADISTGRIQFWTIALQIFAAHPILGSGLDTYGVAYTFYDPQSGFFRVEQAHNDYLQTLSDGGILGFACVAAFVVLLFRNGIRTIKRSSDALGRSIALGSLAGCFGIAIHSFFDFPLRTPSNALFFLLLVVLATTTLRVSTPHLSNGS
jgi:O-antigen ligase